MSIDPKNKKECRSLQAVVSRSLTLSCIPDASIKVLLPTVPLRTSLKRLREKVIGDGYRLFMHLEDAIEDERNIKAFMWREETIVMWNHFTLSVERMHEFVNLNCVKKESAVKGQENESKRDM